MAPHQDSHFPLVFRESLNGKDTRNMENSTNSLRIKKSEKALATDGLCEYEKFINDGDLLKIDELKNKS